MRTDSRFTAPDGTTLPTAGFSVAAHHATTDLLGTAVRTVDASTGFGGRRA
ncbi:hypothetical protein [Streptomyces sp. SID3343]|uniref:hypothetical protein n=1 Tax=Streptomyces sp. SID3343 TaxID=2690260 RepID=UPI00136928D0|nr:hypothetical protein [Streptomyces sp. SID3343]